MSPRSYFTHKIHEMPVSSKSRYQGNRLTKRAPGQITPLILRPAPNAMNTTRKSKPNHSSGDVSPRDIRQDTTDDVFHNRPTKNDDERSIDSKHYIAYPPIYWPDVTHHCLAVVEPHFAPQDARNDILTQRTQTHEPHRPRIGQQYIPHHPDRTFPCERPTASEDPRPYTQTYSNSEAAGPFFSLQTVSREKATTYYEATIGHHQTKTDVTRIRSLPRIIITPPTPTIYDFQKQSARDGMLLEPPPPCHRRKERHQQARFDAEKLLLLRKRNGRTQTDTSKGRTTKTEIAHTYAIEQKPSMSDEGDDRSPINRGRSYGPSADIDHTNDPQHKRVPMRYSRTDFITHVNKDEGKTLASNLSRRDDFGRKISKDKGKPTKNIVSRTDSGGRKMNAKRSTAIDYERAMIAKLEHLGF